MYAGLLLPFESYEYQEKKKIDKVYSSIIFESFKKSNDSFKLVDTCIWNYKEMQSIAKYQDNIWIGKLFKQVGSFWSSTMILAIAATC